jgi:pyruvate dehydrogenase E1 component alpha subunit
MLTLKLTTMSNSTSVLSENQYLQSFEQMLLLRRFEEKSGQLYGMGMIAGFCHLYIGQEAVAVATALAKGSDDSIITSYRCHGHIILSGTDPKYVLAELTGKSTGCSRGKGGSMHLFNIPGKFYGGHGIVGAQVPIGTGLAFAEKYKDTQNICYTFFGDGATHQGQVYEAFNMAKLWNLPVLYIIENNEYSMGTSVARCSSVKDLYIRGESFGIPGIQVDGMDLDASYTAIKKASEYVRSGNGPMLLEMKTYRYRGHSMSDPAKYRSKEEVDAYKETRDPIEQVKDIILQYKYASESDLKVIEKRVKERIQEAVDFATSSDEPDHDELYTDMYSEEAI